MLLYLIIFGGVGALALAYVALNGPSASKSVKRRVELIRERHGDVIAGNAQAQIRKLFAERSTKIEGLASTLIPKPALLRCVLYSSIRRWQSRTRRWRLCTCTMTGTGQGRMQSSDMPSH